MTWFRKAAERNDPSAQNNIGWLYQTLGSEAGLCRGDKLVF